MIKDEGEEIIGEAKTGREKAVAATNLKLRLMRRRGYSAEQAGEDAHHELKHMLANKGKRYEAGYGKRDQGKEENTTPFVRPKDTLDLDEQIASFEAPGHMMSDWDKQQVRILKWKKFFRKLGF